MTGKQYITQFILIFIGMCPFIAWGVINIYLDKRDRKRNERSS
jgi:hypothetical protein